jgi:glutaryl-CoA dehydrogenase
MMLGTALVTDHLLVREQFDEAESEPVIRTRRFVDEEVLPVINDYWERAEFPWPLARRLAELELLDEGMSPLALGLVHMELNRGDGSLGTFFGVQTGLAMKAIEMLGSPEQQARWLGPMARLDAIGAFALTEPDHGSDSVALETSARREGDTWVLNGAKRWIGNGTIADVAVVWARSTEDGQVKGFLVETGAPWYHA